MSPKFQKLHRVDSRQPDEAVVLQAAELLKRGELIVLPTETVYGLAADPRNPDAVDRIYRVKGRPESKDIPLLAADLEQVEKAGGMIRGAARRLAERFWPGALTLVVPAGGVFKGFRIPDYEIARAVIRASGSVLAVTSANRSNEPPARTATDALQALGEANVALILDAGPSPGGVPSTVVKLTGDKVEILREGAISEAEIRKTAEG